MRRLIWLVALSAATWTTACDRSASDTGSAPIAAVGTPDPRDAELSQLRDEVADLRRQVTELRSPVPKPKPKAAVVEVESAKPKVAMCFKAYCPFDPPQGGPDTVLCDQLEQGVVPDINLMIAGRGMREVRRQLATGDY